MSLLYNFFGKVLFWIYSFVGNYGLAIVIFSILAKIIQLPITSKQIKSQEASKEVMPKVEALREKYKNNQQRLSEEMMKVYREHNFNPMSGCLPMIVQLLLVIVFFRIVRMPEMYVFTNGGIEAASGSFLWVQNMALSPNQIFAQAGVSVQLLLSLILPVITVISTVWMQRQSAAGNDAGAGGMGATMKMMNLILPVMIAVFSLSYTPALCLYWSMNTILQIIQYYIMKDRRENLKSGDDTLLR